MTKQPNNQFQTDFYSCTIFCPSQSAYYEHISRHSSVVLSKLDLNLHYSSKIPPLPDKILLFLSMYSMLGQKEDGEGRSDLVSNACCNFFNRVIQKALGLSLMTVICHST